MLQQILCRLRQREVRACHLSKMGESRMAIRSRLSASVVAAKCCGDADRRLRLSNWPSEVDAEQLSLESVAAEPAGHLQRERATLLACE